LYATEYSPTGLIGALGAHATPSRTEINRMAIALTTFLVPQDNSRLAIGDLVVDCRAIAADAAFQVHRSSASMLQFASVEGRCHK